MNNTEDKPSLMSASLQSFLGKGLLNYRAFHLHGLALSIADPDDS